MKKIILISLFVGICYTATSQVLISILPGDVLNSEKIESGLDRLADGLVIVIVNFAIKISP